MVTESTPVVDFFGKSRTYIPMTDAELAAVIGEERARGAVGRGTDAGELAGACGIAVPHISRLEKGNHLPSVATLKKVSDALKVPICSLLDPPDAEPKRKKPKKPGTE
jgi:transcriptional regulator with XRE-family HTH domain